MSVCPVCRGDCTEYVIDLNNNEIIGCNNCTTTRDSEEYDAEEAEMLSDYHRETFMSDK